MENVIPFHRKENPDDYWINASQAASRKRKKAGDWFNSPETQSYIAAMRAQLRTDKPLVRKSLTGILIHPALQPHFAKWIRQPATNYPK